MPYQEVLYPHRIVEKNIRYEFGSAGYIMAILCRETKMLRQIRRNFPVMLFSRYPEDLLICK
jgi:hypothetical protein